MIVQYQYILWNPPHLTEAEELEFGRRIALVGRDHFVREFRESIGKAKPHQPKTDTPALSPGAAWACLIVVGGLSLFGLTSMTEREWRRMSFLIILVMVIVLSIYFGSVYLATRKFELWIDKLVAKYAAHVARGGH